MAGSWVQILSTDLHQKLKNSLDWKIGQKLFEVWKKEKYGKSFVLLKINGKKQTFIGSHFLGVKPTYPNRYFGAMKKVQMKNNLPAKSLKEL